MGVCCQALCPRPVRAACWVTASPAIRWVAARYRTSVVDSADMPPVSWLERSLWAAVHCSGRGSASVSMVQTIRRVGVRRSLVAVALLVTAAALSPAVVTASAPRRPRLEVTTETVGRGAERAAIVRDSYGVPSVYARGMPGVWFGAGWAQAEDRLVQLELTRRTVEGTLSEIAGPSELAQDEDVRTFFYTPAELAAQERSLPADMRRALQAFADGINGYEDLAYASRANERRLVPYEFWTLGQLLGLGARTAPAPWTAADTVAVGNYLAREFGGGGGSELSNLAFLRYLQAELRCQGRRPSRRRRYGDLQRLALDRRSRPRRPRSPDRRGRTPLRARRARGGRGAVAPAGSASPATPDAKPGTAATSRSMTAVSNISGAAAARAGAALARDRRQILATGISLKVLAHGGSNAFAVAPWRSRDSTPCCGARHRRALARPASTARSTCTAPGYDAGGMDITGEPFVLIGRNADVAWTTTSEELVDQRVYVEKVDFSSSPPTYLYDGSWVPMQAIQEQIPVAGAAPQPFTVYRTIDGPVFSTDPSQGIAFSMRFASFGRETGTLTGFAQLGGDRDLAQFEHSMSLLTTMHNFLYADRLGQHRLLRRRARSRSSRRSPASTRGCPRSATGPSSGWATSRSTGCPTASTRPRASWTTGTPSPRSGSSTSRTAATSTGARSSARSGSRSCWRPALHHYPLPGKDRARHRPDRQRRQHPPGRALLHPVRRAAPTSRSWPPTTRSWTRPPIPTWPRRCARSPTGTTTRPLAARRCRSS